MRVLSEMERRRYARHISMEEVGEKGQLKLLSSKVLIVGAGGLGSSVGYYLAAAGVGTLGIVDNDVVEESNLQRQILHTTDRLGMTKTESARQTLSRFNPSITLQTFEERLSSANVEEIFAPFDIVVQASDNFPTRYLINDACVHLKKPCVYGSVFHFEGQVTVFDPTTEGPCYRCLYPKPPSPKQAPSCVPAGVLGVLPGIIGSLQAQEVLKLLLGVGKPLIGRLLTYDGLTCIWREFQISKNEDCRLCAKGRPFLGYADHEELCKQTGLPLKRYLP